MSKSRPEEKKGKKENRPDIFSPRPKKTNPEDMFEPRPPKPNSGAGKDRR